MDPSVCSQCPTRSCTKSPEGTVDVCEWGVAFFHENGRLLKKETLVPLKYLSQNLRHEVHRILSLIVDQASQLDPTLSRRRPDLTAPPGRILGATLVIDHFLQMVAGVHDFHPTTAIRRSKRRELLSEMVERYFSIYALIRNPRRPRRLNLQIDQCRGVELSMATECLEYVIAVLLDNTWKYSLEATTVSVSASGSIDGYADIKISNVSKPLKDSARIFERGYQNDRNADGFGFGLFWARTLIHYYNELRRNASPLTELVHHEVIDSKNTAIQEFIIKNVVCERSK